MIILSKDSKFEQMLQAAKMYYYEKLSQQEIADILHMSRSNVSRLLNTCLDNNIIEIKINDSIAISPEVANQIKRTFELKDVFISASYSNAQKSFDAVGALTAAYLKSVFKPRMRFGVTSGHISKCVSDHIASPNITDIDVVQIMGGTCVLAEEYDGQIIAADFAAKLVGKAYILQAPLLVKSKQIKSALINEPVIKNTLDLYQNIDVALINVGRININDVGNSVLTKADRLQLLELNAIASFAGRYFDIAGMQCNAGINERVIGIEIDDLKKISLKVAAVVGKEKLKAVLSILRSGLLDVLILDEVLANALTNYI